MTQQTPRARALEAMARAIWESRYADPWETAMGHSRYLLIMRAARAALAGLCAILPEIGKESVARSQCCHNMCDCGPRERGWHNYEESAFVQLSALARALGGKDA